MHEFNQHKCDAQRLCCARAIDFSESIALNISFISHFAHFFFFTNFPFVQILFPLQFTNMVNKVDVVAEAEGGGYMGQAGAIRYGLSLALRSFLDEEKIEDMRVGKSDSFPSCCCFRSNQFEAF